jgi:hypothetical protein
MALSGNMSRGAFNSWRQTICGEVSRSQRRLLPAQLDAIIIEAMLSITPSARFSQLLSPRDLTHCQPGHMPPGIINLPFMVEPYFMAEPHFMVEPHLMVKCPG